MPTDRRGSITDRTMIIICIVTSGVMIAFITVIAVNADLNYSLSEILLIDVVMALVFVLGTSRALGALRKNRMSQQDTQD